MIDLDDKYFLFTCDIEYAGSNTEKGVDEILKLLYDYNAKGTFFVTYCIISEYPNIVDNIIRHGHEIASHGYSHQYLERDYKYLNSLSNEDIEKEISLSFNKFHENGIKVRGFRAPSFKINEYALECIKRTFEYDSSSVDFLLRAGRYTGLYKDIHSDNGFTYIPVTSLGKLKTPFGSPYLLGFGSKAGYVLKRNLSSMNVAVYYSHGYDLVPVPEKFKSVRKLLARPIYLNLCGTKRAYNFYNTLFSITKELGYLFITCSQLCETLEK